MTTQKMEMNEIEFREFIRTIPNFLIMNRSRKRPRLLIREKRYYPRNFNAKVLPKIWIAELIYDR
ncbi:MAG: hypothetical protein QXN16_03820 [Candidatus Micrarchaeaceae archaeon]